MPSLLGRRRGRAQNRTSSAGTAEWVVLAVAVLAVTCAAAAAHFGAGTPATATNPATQPLVQLPLSLPASARAVKAPVLMYHYVDADAVPGPAGSALTVRTKSFEQQMDFLARDGYHTVTLEQVYAAMAGASSLPSNPVALTFDDGGSDDYEVALPILRAHHFVASFFVITDFVGAQDKMTWDQLRAMQAEGMMIESHSARHADLTKLGPAALAEELLGSRNTLETELGRAPVALSYPFGYYNQRVIDAVRAAGYRMALSTREGRRLSPGSIYSLPRIHVDGMETIRAFERSLGHPVTL